MYSLNCFFAIAITLISSAAHTTKIEHLDNAPVVKNAYLQHLGLALGADERLKAIDLVYGSTLDFKVAPDPSRLLKGMQKKNGIASQKRQTRLRLMSYNVALLEAKALGLVTIMRSPFLDERREKLPQAIFSTRADVIFLQEVWVESVDFFERAARRNGYTCFYSHKKNYDDGLMTLIKNDLIDNANSFSSRSFRFDTQNLLEVYGSPGVARGVVTVSVEDEEMGHVHFYNTHLLSFRGNWQSRLEQARELGRDIVNATHDNDLVFVAGDMNAGPFYRDDHWAGYFGFQAQDWWKNAAAYPVLLHYGRLDDLMVMGLSEKDADIDVHYGHSVINDPSLAKNIPGADADWCKNTPHKVFTATDCNNLHFMQYPGYEQPARQDHLLVHDSKGRVHVHSREILFTEPVCINDNTSVELSDHYAVMADVDIGK